MPAGIMLLERSLTTDVVNQFFQDVIYGLGRVNYKYLLLMRTVKFYKRLYLKYA